MSELIPKDTKLLRLASASFDMNCSLEAYAILRDIATPQDPRFYHAAVSMAVSYGRPFYESTGVGRLFVEYPKFPDFDDPEMNLRHNRLIDLRSKFMAHSSCEGTKLRIVPPGCMNPVGHEVVDRCTLNVRKRSFGDVRFYDWLKDVVVALKSRIDDDLQDRVTKIGVGLTQVVEMETGADDFRWTPSI